MQTHLNSLKDTDLNMKNRFHCKNVGFCLTNGNILDVGSWRLKRMGFLLPAGRIILRNDAEMMLSGKISLVRPWI